MHTKEKELLAALMEQNPTEMKELFKEFRTLMMRIRERIEKG